jgi:broad specificity phosphatase PhoE
VHAEFQRAGFFLTHVLECPLDKVAGQGAEAAALLTKRLEPVATRIRRSLKPKRVVLISRALGPILEKILALELGCPVVLDNGKLFEFDGDAPENTVARLREALAGPARD